MKKALTTFFFFFVFCVFFLSFFSSQLTYFTEVQWLLSKKISFSKVPEGVKHFPGVDQLFPGESNCLFPIEIHLTCNFPGGPDPCSPSGSAHGVVKK